MLIFNFVFLYDTFFCVIDCTLIHRELHGGEKNEVSSLEPEKEPSKSRQQIEKSYQVSNYLQIVYICFNMDYIYFVIHLNTNVLKTCVFNFYDKIEINLYSSFSAFVSQFFLIIDL